MLESCRETKGKFLSVLSVSEDLSGETKFGWLVYDHNHISVFLQLWRKCSAREIQKFRSAAIG